MPQNLLLVRVRRGEDKASRKVREVNEAKEAGEVHVNLLANNLNLSRKDQLDQSQLHVWDRLQSNLVAKGGSKGSLNHNLNLRAQLLERTLIVMAQMTTTAMTGIVTMIPTTMTTIKRILTMLMTMVGTISIAGVTIRISIS